MDTLDDLKMEPVEPELSAPVRYRKPLANRFGAKLQIRLTNSLYKAWYKQAKETSPTT